MERTLKPYSQRRRYSNASTTSGAFVTNGGVSGSAGDEVTVVANVSDASMGSVSLSVVSVPATGGNTVSPGNLSPETMRDGSKRITVPRGSTVRIVANATNGHVLDHFSGTPTPPSTNTGKIDVKANTDCSYTAHFRVVAQTTYHTVRIEWNDAMGTVGSSSHRINKLLGTATAQVATGNNITLTANAATGYKFVRWEGCVIAGKPNMTKTSPTITEQIFDNRTLRAVFEPVNGNGGGGNSGGGSSDTPGNSGGGNDPGNKEIIDPNPGAGGNSTPVQATDALAQVKAFVKKWWWALAIGAYVLYQNRKGGKA